MFSNLYPPVVSGSSTQTAWLARGLAAKGHETIVITAQTSASSPYYEQIDGVHVYRLPSFRIPKLSVALNFPWLTYTFFPKNLRRISKIIDQHQPDILHVHNHMFDLAFAAMVIKRRTRTPMVITIHTVIKHSNSFYNLFLYPADRIFLKHLIINQAHTLICPDQNIVDYVREAFGKDDGTVVPYGIGLPDVPLNGSADRIKAKYQLEGKRIILSLGHVHEIRNRKDLIEALPGVLKKFPNALLLIVGAVIDKSPIAAARKLGIDKSVVFTGPVPHSDIPVFLELAEMEAHWLNQEAPEKTSLGIASLEAMGAGKVILAAANENSYGQGVLKNGANLILVEPGKPGSLANTIIGLFDDRPRRIAIGQAARETVQQHFSWDSVCARTLSVYEDVLRENHHKN